MHMVPIIIIGNVGMVLFNSIAYHKGKTTGDMEGS